MKEREDKPTAPRRGRATVRLTVAEIWREIVGGIGRDVTKEWMGKGIQIIGARRRAVAGGRFRVDANKDLP